MKMLTSKTTDEIIERLAFVYYALTTPDHRSLAVTCEIADQIDEIVSLIGGYKECKKLVQLVHIMKEHGCEQFIQEYGTHWSKESFKESEDG